MHKYKKLNLQGFHIIPITAANPILALFIICAALGTLSAQSSHPLDPKNLKTIEQRIEAELPAVEKGWFLDRNPGSIEEYEWAFARDTFRVRRVQCMLFDDFFEAFDQVESDSTFWQQDEAIIGPIVRRRDSTHLAIYQQTAQRYELLVDRYIHLIMKSSYGGKERGPWKTNIRKSQKAWLKYRSLMLNVRTLNDFSTTSWLIQLNRQRLLEIYDLYGEIME